MAIGKRADFNEMADNYEAGAATDSGPNTGGNPVDKLDELASLVKSLMQSQVTRDQQMEKESTQQGVRWRSM